MKTTFPRDFYKPHNSIEIKAADSTAVAYIGTSRQSGKVQAVGFSGKRNKPDFNYVFRDESQARAHIAQHAAGVKQSEETRAKWRTERAADICHTPVEVWTKARERGSITARDAAVCLRACLAREFPGVKFSVRSDRSLNVSWTDGPSYEQVDRIAQAYSFDGFDGMVDCRYSIKRWLARDGSASIAHTEGHAGGGGSECIGDPHKPDAVLVTGGPDFVFCRRGLSPETEMDLARKVAKRYGWDMPAAFSSPTEFQQWLNRSCRPDGSGRIEYLQQYIYQASTGVLPV